MSGALGRTLHGLQARVVAAAAILCATVGVVAATPAGRHDGGAARACGTVTIVAAGDVLLDRGVRKAIERGNTTAKNVTGGVDSGGGTAGVKALLSGVAGLFSEADIGLVNLECPATTTAAPAAKRFVFRAEPEWLRPLKEAGISDLCLANNHTLDQGPGGLGDTIEAALGADLGVVGAGHTFREARAPLVRRFGSGNGDAGITVALLAYNLFPQEGVVFDPDRPWVCSFDPDTIRDEIEAACEAAGVVVVSFHWGKEFSGVPGPAQVDLAHRACDWGAELVIGHHPHVMQGIEVYRPAGGTQDRTSLIAYSLGNFVFDQEGVRAGVVDTASTSETFVLKVEVGEAGLLRAEVIPVVIDNCSPVAAGGEDAAGILQRVATLSRAFGTSIAPDGLVMWPTRHDSR